MPLLSETLPLFNAVILAKGKTANYADWATRIMRVVIRDIDDLRVHDISKETMILYLVELRKRLKKTSFDSYKRGMKVYFEWSSSHYDFVNPLEDIPYPATHQVDNLDMQVSTYRKMWAIANVRNRAVLAMALSSMARAKELLQLNLTKVNVISRTQLIIGKGQKSRNIYWDAFAWEHVEKWIATRPYKSDWIFTKANEPEPLTYWGLREAFRRMSVIAEISDDEKCNLHSIRNLGAVESAKKGMSMPELSQRLGHSVSEVTKRYARYRPSTMKAQSEKFDIIRGVLDD